MNYQKDKEYNLKYVTNDGETKEVELKPEKAMTTPEVIMKLKNDNKDFFKLLENKEIKKESKDYEEFNKRLIQAMEVLGFDYNDIDSYDSWIVFNSLYTTDRITFRSWGELEDWINDVVIDDPEEAKAVNDILDKWYKLPTKDRFEDESLEERKERLVEDMEDTIKSEKGFYIGDPCYVLPDEIYNEIWGDKYNFKDGKIEVGDKAFLVHGTAYGDGEYFDGIGTSYGVDSGTLALIPLELIKDNELIPDEGAYEYGKVVYGTKGSLKYYDDETGMFEFIIDSKPTIIETGDIEYNDDDDYINEEDNFQEDDEDEEDDD